MQNKKMTRAQGFTLLEILMALFIFTIVSMIMTSALHQMIDTQSKTEIYAERLRQVQLALLLMSRDIEQATDRPISNTVGKEEPAFVGTAKNFTFTHMGYANQTSKLMKSSLKRTSYAWHDDALWRLSWEVLDQAPDSQAKQRHLLQNVVEVNFEYLDKKGHFQKNWPLMEEPQALPRAVRVVLNLQSWGRISQLFLIAAQPGLNTSAQPTGIDPKKGKLPEDLPEHMRE